MEMTDDFLQTNIRSILNTITDEIVNCIIQALKDVGVEALSDLQYVHEEDLICVLKAIPRRKLINAWSAKPFISPPPHPANKRLKYQRPLKCKWTFTKRLTLLQVYNKYKKLLFSPNVDEQNVWRNIAEEVRVKCLLNCDVRLRNKKLFNQHAIMFVDEARKAFETTEDSVTVVDSMKL